MYLFLITFSCIIIGISSDKSHRPCKISDNDCMRKEAMYFYNSWSEENRGTIDPLHKDVIEANFPTLNVTFFDTDTTGFSKCIVKDFKFYGDKLKNDLKFELKLYCPLLVMKGDCNMKGVLLTLPVEGKGKFTLDCKEYVILLHADMNIYPGSDGKDVGTVKRFKVDVESFSGVIFDFKNLFNGQKELSDAANKFANENSKAVAEAVQGPFLTANLETLIKVLNKQLKSIPLDSYIDFEA